MEDTSSPSARLKTSCAILRVSLASTLQAKDTSLFPRHDAKGEETSLSKGQMRIISRMSLLIFQREFSPWSLASQVLENRRSSIKPSRAGLDANSMTARRYRENTSESSMTSINSCLSINLPSDAHRAVTRRPTPKSLTRSVCFLPRPKKRKHAPTKKDASPSMSAADAVNTVKEKDRSSSR